MTLGAVYIIWALACDWWLSGRVQTWVVVLAAVWTVTSHWWFTHES